VSINIDCEEDLGALASSMPDYGKQDIEINMAAITSSSKMVLLGAMSFLFWQSPSPSMPVDKTQPAQAESRQAKATDENRELPSIPSTEPVITIRGLCSDVRHPETKASKSEKTTDCETFISKKEFEALMNAVNLGGQTVRPDTRKSFAETYANLLLFERAAEKAGFANTENFHEILRWLTLRTMADGYYRSIQDKYHTPTQSEIDAYYKDHISSFETVKLARIFIPTENFAIQDKVAFEKKAQDAATAAHERAVKGDDPDQIQKEVYANLDLPAAPPTDLGIKRRSDLLATEAVELFKLSSGEISQIEKEPKSYVIYKVVSKETLSEAKVKSEISKTLTQQNTNAAIQAVRDSAEIELNPKYFGASDPKTTPSVQVPPLGVRH
jgi:hypothetical protein